MIHFPTMFKTVLLVKVQDFYILEADTVMLMASVTDAIFILM